MTRMQIIGAATADLRGAHVAIRKGKRMSILNGFVYAIAITAVLVAAAHGEPLSPEGRQAKPVPGETSRARVVQTDRPVLGDSAQEPGEGGLSLAKYPRNSSIRTGFLLNLARRIAKKPYLKPTAPANAGVASDYDAFRKI